MTSKPASAPIATPPRAEGAMTWLSRGLLVLGGLFWLSTVAAALAFQMRRERIAGPTGPAPVQWPARTTLGRSPNRPTLVLFAHPRCGCTRVTIDSLELMLRRAKGSVDAYAVFVRPDGTDEAWTETPLLERARSIPGLIVTLDPAGEEARRFGCSSSGHILFFDRDGSLKFSGGITSARAAEGPSAGLEAILSLLKTGSAPWSRTPVYGCPLLNEAKEKP
jgi:hypothetical protein